MNPLPRVLGIAAIALNVVDALLHVATDQVEPLRIAGNVVVVLGGILLLALPALRRAILPVAIALVSLALNLIVILTTGIGTVGLVLIGVTTVLLGALAVTLRRSPGV